MGHWYYDYSKFIVKEPKLIPSTPHFALMVFKKESHPDSYDGSTTVTSTVCDYYAFPDEATWTRLAQQYCDEMMRSKNHSSNEELVFFKSSGRAKIDVKVSVQVKE